jgi:hypothetical protein
VHTRTHALFCLHYNNKKKLASGKYSRYKLVYPKDGATVAIIVVKNK